MPLLPAAEPGFLSSPTLIMGPGAQSTEINCTNYDTVKSGDSCGTVVNRNHIAIAIFQSLNPKIDTGCTNLVVGDQYCVQAGNATNLGYLAKNCSTLQQEREGDTCNKLATQNNISLGTFLSLNPTVNGNCTNLQPKQFYCVRPLAGTADAATGTKLSSSATSVPTSMTGDQPYR